MSLNCPIILPLHSSLIVYMIILDIKIDNWVLASGYDYKVKTFTCVFSLSIANALFLSSGKHDTRKEVLPDARCSLLSHFSLCLKHHCVFCSQMFHSLSSLGRVRGKDIVNLKSHLFWCRLSEQGAVHNEMSQPGRYAKPVKAASPPGRVT